MEEMLLEETEETCKTLFNSDLPFALNVDAPPPKERGKRAEPSVATQSIELLVIRKTRFVVFTTKLEV